MKKCNQPNFETNRSNRCWKIRRFFVGTLYWSRTFFPNHPFFFEGVKFMCCLGDFFSGKKCPPSWGPDVLHPSWVVAVIFVSKRKKKSKSTWEWQLVSVWMLFFFNKSFFQSKKVDLFNSFNWIKQILTTLAFRSIFERFPDIVLNESRLDFIESHGIMVYLPCNSTPPGRH